MTPGARVRVTDSSSVWDDSSGEVVRESPGITRPLLLVEFADGTREWFDVNELVEVPS